MISEEFFNRVTIFTNYFVAGEGVDYIYEIYIYDIYETR